jgi:BlaI family transcriptional regulator, penicillinase repressor
MKQIKDPPELSKAEFDILRVLWKHGKLSVREAHDHVRQINGWALTTTRTVMDRMAKKGLLDKQDYHGIFLYTAMMTRPAGFAKMVRYFADHVLETDAASVVAMFSNTKTISPEEIEELKQLLDE